MRIKELKSNIKIIREIKREAEGDKEIRELTEGEMPVSESEVERAVGAADVPLDVGAARTGRSVLTRPIDQPARGEETREGENIPLYDVGKSMGGELRRDEYKPVETIGTGSNLRAVGVGRDFAMGQQVGDYPEANRIESSLRQEDEKKYSTGMETTGPKGRTKRYGWEV